jgi:HTH-type transcriptional repressor of NAD biosynthesis genes
VVLWAIVPVDTSNVRKVESVPLNVKIGRMGTRGLTLGKFAPLHRGHQDLVETALAEVDELVVIVYDSPHVTTVPLGVRAGWIRSLYPRVRVVEAWDGPTEVGDDPQVRRAHEDYVLGDLGIAGITHFYSGEFYGGHMSRALGARDRRVGRTRAVSGTAVRARPLVHRALVDPLVYRDLVTRVVLLGAPGTGKTTLAAALAEAHGTVWMPEYGREYWERHQQDRRLTPDQLVEIAEGHLVREDALVLDADGVLFTDTDATTTALFAQAYHGRVPPRVAELADAARPDLVVVCDTDIPYPDTWDRSGEADRRVFQRRVLDDLRSRRTPFVVVRGDLDARVATVGALLRRFRRYDNLLESLASP